MRKILSLFIAYMAFSCQVNANTISTESNVDSTLNGFGAKLRESNFHLGVELQSKYLWRGQEYGTSPAVFPTVHYDYKGLSIGAIGAYAWDGSHQECDLYASYSTSGLTIAVTDYYYPTAVGAKDQFFELDNKKAGHMFEATLAYEHKKVPVSILLSTFFAGADKNLEGNQAWSSYLELGTHYDFLENNSVSLAVGSALNKSFYNNFETGFSVVNIALKYTYNVQFKNNWNLPLSASYVINPQKEKSFINFSASFGF